MSPHIEAIAALVANGDSALRVPGLCRLRIRCTHVKHELIPFVTKLTIAQNGHKHGTENRVLFHESHALEA